MTSTPLSAITLRPIVLEDADFLCRLANEPLLLEQLAEVPTSLQDWQNNIRFWLQDADEMDLLICRKIDGLPLGWAGVNGLQDRDATAWLKFIALHPSHWGHGYAAAALNRIMDDLRQRSIARLRLWTDQSNLRAKKLYLQHGFAIIEIAIKPTGSRMDMRERLLMECPLE